MNVKNSRKSAPSRSYFMSDTNISSLELLTDNKHIRDEDDDNDDDDDDDDDGGGGDDDDDVYPSAWFNLPRIWG